MNLLRDLQDSLGFSVSLHRPRSGHPVKYMSHSIGVMYSGKIMEITARQELYKIRSTRIPRHYCPRFPYPTLSSKAQTSPNHPDG